MTGWRPAMPVTQWRVDEAMIVAGIGCRRARQPPDIDAAIRAALARAGLAADALDAIATPPAKRGEAGHRRGGADARRAARAGAARPSSKPRARARRPAPSACIALIGVPSVAEAAALAAAGPSARLVSAAHRDRRGDLRARRIRRPAP